jgi:hypothetical protein
MAIYLYCISFFLILFFSLGGCEFAKIEKKKRWKYQQDVVQ